MMMVMMMMVVVVVMVAVVMMRRRRRIHDAGFVHLQKLKIQGFQDLFFRFFPRLFQGS